MLPPLKSIILILILNLWKHKCSSIKACPGLHPAPSDDSKIIGGEIAARFEFPYQLLVHSRRPNRMEICGASIIGPYWALTAAHCVYSDDPSFTLQNVFIGTGFYSHDEFDGSEYILEVANIIIHPLFNISTTSYDIALIQVSSPFLDTRASQPVPLAGALQPFPPGFATVTGWGTTSDNPTASASRTLRKVSVTVFDDAFCQSIYDWYDRDMYLCAGNIEGGNGICRGDSGGPLVRNGYQIGVAVTSGEACGLPNRPDIYIRVSSFRPWISSVSGIGKLFPDDSTKTKPHS